ncbi:MAG: hypothetical protein QM692_02535 [Thermomicrobiales bacterium]
MEAIILFAAVLLLIVLAVAAMRKGVDTRDGFATEHYDTSIRGLVWSR